MQFFLRYAYAPLFWSGFIGLATWQVGYRQASHAWLVALFLGALGLSFLAERRLPYQPRWNRPHADRLRDVLHASVNESLNALGILALPLLAGVLSFWPVWPQAWPLWLQLLLAIVLADLGITLVHYASHRSALLWRLHAVHHSVQRLYGFNGLMK
ncbi:TPA: sterol desaturase family protein, partial [Pseudomonas aeruginosa]|nr:sterol desaturase family protein [Pseudomonas aeruginosa]